MRKTISALLLTLTMLSCGKTERAGLSEAKRNYTDNNPQCSDNDLPSDMLVDFDHLRSEDVSTAALQLIDSIMGPSFLSQKQKEKMKDQITQNLTEQVNYPPNALLTAVNDETPEKISLDSLFDFHEPFTVETRIGDYQLILQICYTRNSRWAIVGDYELHNKIKEGEIYPYYAYHQAMSIGLNLQVVDQKSKKTEYYHKGLSDIGLIFTMMDMLQEQMHDGVQGC